MMLWRFGGVLSCESTPAFLAKILQKAAQRPTNMFFPHEQVIGRNGVHEQLRIINVGAKVMGLIPHVAEILFGFIYSQKLYIMWFIMKGSEKSCSERSEQRREL